MPPAQSQIQNTSKGRQDFTMSTNSLDTSNSSNNLAPNATNQQAIHSHPPSRVNLITGVSQQTPSTNTPSSTQYDKDVQERLMKKIKKSLKENIPESGFQHKPYIFSEQDFKMKMAAYLALNDRETHVDTLDDFPIDPDVQRHLVQEIVEAMLNMDKNTLIDPEAKLPLARIKKLSPFELDLMAWNVLIETRDIHNGKVSLPSWGKDWPWEDFSSFSERFDAVKKALYHCKAMVSSLFDDKFAKRLPLNPTAEFSRKNSNKTLNGKRKKYFELEKDAIQNESVPWNLRQTPPDSVLSTGHRSFSPQFQQASSVRPGHKRRRIEPQATKTGHDAFSVDQNTAFSTNLCGQPQSAPNPLKDMTQFPVQDETGSGTNKSGLTQQSAPNTGSMLESPYSFQAQQERLEGVIDSNGTEQSLPANNIQQWFDETFGFPNQEVQQAMDSNLDPGLFDATQVNPASNEQQPGQGDFPNDIDFGNMENLQEGQKTLGAILDQSFGHSIQPSTTYHQQESMPASSTSQNLYQSSRQDLNSPLEQQALKQPSDQDKAMHEGSHRSNSINDPLSSEELKRLFNMPDYFDLELGELEDEHGETMDFSSFW
ncbi:hypothetical protein VP1G_08774 [Cytospora mali]|uniref:Uncharacterized protein n=1 Tax=Cytospora mali TaxID=578113 RepID=A0A194VC86_CYTMA|nr:hypothetical protein VP1G_08774 [Valsa mali var. pyri (nom. inval.)]